MPPDRQQHQLKAHEIHRGKGLVVHLSLALSTIQVTVRCGSVPPQFRENILGVVRGFLPLFLFRHPHE
ncbi:hypothetical protein TNCV_1971051 [Trichonephila clavipes]|uniref:Uncharacterized protein n=1 Tax=Trichonephila clavipes TaxID=2585209 RepID=A0A8X6W661_TRICX|nr:hypothetical protein TNCV_1971051 [Trichonephila clavipes]